MSQPWKNPTWWAFENSRASKIASQLAKPKPWAIFGKSTNLGCIFFVSTQHELHLKIWHTTSSLLSEFFIQKKPGQVLVTLVQISVYQVTSLWAIRAVAQGWFKDLHELKFLTNFGVNLTSSPEAVTNLTFNTLFITPPENEIRLTSL